MTEEGSEFPWHGSPGITIPKAYLRTFAQWMLSGLLMGVLGGLPGTSFRYILHGVTDLRAANNWLIWFLPVGGAVILLMTLLVVDHRYNGAGMGMALAAVTGQADWYDFALKLLFTAVTLAAGFKGGEIVPTFCIGATFGCVAGGLLGLDPGFAAALGLVGLFCCATNSPIASIVLSVEMFGSANLPWFALVCVITFVLSGNSGLYGSQIIRFSKNSLPQDPLRKENKN